MTLLGQAAIAMWWDIAPAQQAEFEHWHSHEHFPERLSIPGFRRGTRWKSASGGEGYFVVYELEAYETLTSPHYLARLNDPTPWSRKMMPHHRNMVRSQCRVMASFGAGVSGHALTLRFSPASDAALKTLAAALGELPTRPGIAGAHLLHTQTPPATQTAEQRIRGGDAAADWIVLVSGYDREALAALELLPAARRDLFRLSHTLAKADL
ncbi:MAG: hypothetical protein AB7R90_00080 [Reyranellaceae bacterium]